MAIAILSIIMLMLASMTGSLMSLWQGGQAHNERRTNTQAIFDRMARDLQQIAVPATRYGNPALFNTNSLEMAINPSGVSATYKFPQAMFWQAPLATDGATNGNMAIVGYFVQWVNGSPALCRVLINPSAAPYSIYSTPGNWINDTMLTNAPATAAYGYQGLMSPNVLGLWFQALDGTGNPTVQSADPTHKGEVFDSRLSYSYVNYLYTNGGVPVSATVPPCSLPSAVQVAIVIVDSATARHLTGGPLEKPSTLSGDFWGDIQSFYNGLPAVIRKGAEIQTTTVQISNGPR